MTAEETASVVQEAYDRARDMMGKDFPDKGLRHYEEKA